MALPTSRSELIEYSLRELGAPVINIEFDDAQVDDRVDYALRKFIDRHYDGQTETFSIIPIYKEDAQNGYVKFDDDTHAVIELLRPASSSSIEPFDSIEYYTMWDYTFGYGSGTGTMSNYVITMSHLSLINFVMGSANLFTYNSISKRLDFHYTQGYIGSANIFGDKYNQIEDAEWEKTNCVAADNVAPLPNGDLDASTITSSGTGVFGIKKTKETDNYIRGIFTTEIILMAGTYTGSIDIIFEDRNGTLVESKTVPLTAMWEKHDFSVEYKTGINDIVVRFETTSAALGVGETFHVWSPSAYANAFIVARYYKALDADEIEGVWKEEWIMKYVTQLIKRQWGHNTKKYTGVQLPGGIETTGQVIFDEAQAQLDILDEQFSMEYELPVDMFFG